LKVPSRAHILVVDDDAAMGKVLVALLSQAELQSEHASSGADALARLEKRPYDLVLTDLRMPGMDGMALLGELARRWPDLPVIMLTAHGNVPLAVEAMKAGAAEFMLKPFDREELVFVVQKVLAGAERTNGVAPAPPTSTPVFGDSAAMREVMDLVRRAAPGNATVLLLGESGTGKELVARSIHEASPRKAKPFVKLNCGALPDALLESELFGYEKGAFTGAATRKPGRIELAHEGTLLLDEIGDITLPMQVKLLRVLQEREIERLGGTTTIKVDVRFLAATHRNLPEMVASGLFREDLFYRLNVVPIHLPPLRSRPEDIESLATRFALEHAKAGGKSIELAPDALRLLSRQTWPGNVRQLQNFIERLVVLCDPPTISAEDVERELARVAPASSSSQKEAGGGLDATRKSAEREAIRTALTRASGNRTVAARILGLSRRGLYYKLDEHGLA
jgi:two-component system, NtrC family, response regulator AtoC